MYDMKILQALQVLEYRSVIYCSFTENTVRTHFKPSYTLPLPGNQRPVLSVQEHQYSLPVESYHSVNSELLLDIV